MRIPCDGSLRLYLLLHLLLHLHTMCTNLRGAQVAVQLAG